MIEYISAGNTVILAIRVMVAGVGQDSVSPAPTVKIQRFSDGLWLSTNNETFEAYDPFSAYRSLVPVASDLSRYTYAWNTGTIVNAVAGDTYFATIDVSAPQSYSVTGEISTALIPAVRAGLALASALATAKTAIDLVGAAVTAIQGAGWTGATDSLRALRAALDAAQADLVLIKGAGFVSGTDDLHSAHTLIVALPAAVNTSLGTSHGTGSWATATGFATPLNVADARDVVVVRVDQSDSDFFAYASGILEPFLANGDVLVAATSSVVTSNIAGYTNGFFDGCTLMVGNQSTGRGAAPILSYTTNGTFTLATPLRFTPSTLANDRVFVLATPTPAAPAALAASEAAITNAIAAAQGAVAVAPGGIGASSFAAGALTAAALGSGFVAAVQSGLAMATAVTTLQNNVSTLLAGVNVAAIAADVITGASIASTATAEIAAAVWAVTDGTMTKGAALDLLRRRTTNKRVLSVLGVLSFFADDSTTVEKTSTVKDIANAAISPIAGEASQATAEV